MVYGLKLESSNFIKAGGENLIACSSSKDGSLRDYRQRRSTCDSEFFHGKGWEALKLRLENGNNSTYWIKKITRNMERDKENEQALRFREWTVLRFWGEDIRKHTDDCVRAVEEVVWEQKIQCEDDEEYGRKSDI